MPYTTPPTAVAGQTLSAADWNLKIRDSLEHVAKPPAARAYRSTVFSVPNAAVTAVPFSAIHHDSGAIWNAATPSRLTVPAGGAGIWHVGAVAQYAINATGARHFSLNKNGGQYASFNAAGSASWYVGGMLSFDLYAAVGEYFELFAYQNSGAALNVDTVYPVAIWAHQVSRA